MRGTILTIEPSSQHTHSVILLHGRGSTAEEFNEDFFESTSTKDNQTLLEHFPSIRWILPSAPEQYSTVFQECMPEWFDIYSLTDPELRQDLQVKGIEASHEWICEMITDEMQTVPSENIFLGGISQGCATALLAFLSSGCKLAGFIGISGWLPFDTLITQIMSNDLTNSIDSTDWNPVAALLHRLYQVDDAVADSREDRYAKLRIAVASHRASSQVLLCHGTDDPIVDVSLGRNMRDALLLLGYTVEWREDADCGHWLKEPEGLDSMIDFISSRGVNNSAHV